MMNAVLLVLSTPFQEAGGKSPSTKPESATEAGGLLKAPTSIDEFRDQGGILWEILSKFLAEYGPKLIFALLWLVVGWLAIKAITWFARRALHFRSIDESVRGFLLSLLDVALKVLLVVMLLGTLGVPTASLGFIVGADSLAIGFALKGTLANFAGGVLILVLKPYKVGDYIEAQGFSGTVKRIEMFWTVLSTPDNKRVIIPNGGLSTSSLTNYSSEPTRRLDVVFGIGYGDDIDHAFAILKRIIESDPRTLKDPEPVIKVVELGASSVDINVRLWLDRSDFWSYKVDLLKTVKAAFDAEGISFPYPQTEVTLHSTTS